MSVMNTAFSERSIPKFEFLDLTFRQEAFDG